MDGSAFAAKGRLRTLLERARTGAAKAGVEDGCDFCTETAEQADPVTSLDAFEHFGEPKLALDAMYRLLRPGGTLVASFGPTWFHPLGRPYRSAS